jgi:hypothetical protein
MLDEMDFDNSIATCSECGRNFYVPLEHPEPGRCKTCHEVLCGEGYQAAIRLRRGECVSCDAAKRPEWEPPKPPVPPPATHCPAGHPMVASNTYEWAGVLRCKECRRAYFRERQRRLRAEAKARKAEQSG